MVEILPLTIPWWLTRGGKGLKWSEHCQPDNQILDDTGDPDHV